MSVINQMLKDLEQRSPEQGAANVAPVAVTEKNSTIKVVAYTVFILLIVNAVGIYIWQLLNENSALKQQNQAKPTTAEVVSSEKTESTAANNNQEGSEVEAISPTKVAKDVIAIKETYAKQMAAKNMPRREVVTEQVSAKPVSEQPADNTEVTPNEAEIKQTSVQAEPEAIITPAPTASKDIQPPSQPVAKMSVSRRQLTAEELVAQKMAQAEKLLAAKDIAKAEQQLEDILIVSPSHVQARKKLAALWFGRKAYPKASNLLSQGIALYPQDSSFRVMKAQVHLKQQQAMLAYQTLLPLATLEDVEYQLMLANVAQQSSQWQSAVDAYQLLKKMQPSSGRWPLGLAIVYDKSSQFPLAIQAYKEALLKSGITAASAEFAEQRIKALGE